MTPREFDFAMKYKIEHEQNEQKFEANKMRLQTYHIVQRLAMSETKIQSLEQMMPFDWDDDEKEEKPIEVTEKDFQEFDKKYLQAKAV